MHQQGKIVNKCRDAGTKKMHCPTLLVKPCGRVPLSILLDSANDTIFDALFANPHFKGFCAFALSLWFRAQGQKKQRQVSTSLTESFESAHRYCNEWTVSCCFFQMRKLSNNVKRRGENYAELLQFIINF